MWILGGLFSSTPTILYTFGDDKNEIKPKKNLKSKNTKSSVPTIYTMDKSAEIIADVMRNIENL